MELKRPLAAFTAALVTGVCTGLFLHIQFFAVLCFAAAFVLLFVFLFPPKARTSLLLAAICALMFLAGFLRADAQKAQYASCAFPDQCTLTVLGTVEQKEIRNETMYLYLSGVVASTKENTATRFRYGRFLLLCKDPAETEKELLTGNKIRAECSYRIFNEARNDGNFDEEQYYHSLGIAGKAKVKSCQVTDHSYHFLQEWLHQARRKVVRTLYSTVGEEYASVFAAIAAGERSSLSDEVKSLYKNSGIAHILAVSGLHVSLIGMGLLRILRKRLRFLFAAILTSGFLLLYLLFSGMQVSSVRATVMFLIYLIARVCGKNYDMCNSMCIALSILLLSQPYYLTNSGFLLSFGAVGALVYVEPCLRFLLKIKTTFLRSATASFSITLLTLPVITSLYFQFPLYSVLINLLMIPLMSLILSSGLLAGFLGALLPAAGRFLIGSGVFLLTLINSVCEIFLLFPNAIIPTGGNSVFQILSFYLLLILFCVLTVLLKRRWKHKPSLQRKKGSFILRIALLLSICILPVLLLKPGNASHDLTITMFDVDQGESILLENPGGKVFMIDCGSTGITNVWKYRMQSTLRYKGISRVDYLLITHPDQDHLNGITEMLNEKRTEQIEIGCILMPYIKDNYICASIRELALKNGIRFSFLHAGMLISDKEISIKILHPSEDYLSNDTNEYSIVIRLEYRDFSAYFLGDASSEVESKLVKSGLLSDCDLLKVGHHGSAFSTSDAFLKVIKPEIAIISAGLRNSYGHPSEQILKRLHAFTQHIFCTASCGQITVHVSDQVTVRTKLKN